MKLPKLIIWDFDGVICDSLFECITVTKVAASQIEQPGLEVNQYNIHEVCSPEVIMSLYKKMQPLRPFVVKGQDYLWQYFYLSLFERVPKSFTEYQAGFENIFYIEKDELYQHLFYEARKLVQRLMGKRYFTLFTPYPGVLYAFRTSIVKHKNYVCTARDQEGVSLLFKNNGIAFSREKIYSKDYNGITPNNGQSKTEQILNILDSEGGRHQEFVLIEDQVKAPGELNDICSGMKVIHASYGYGLEHDWQVAGMREVKKVNKPEDFFTTFIEVTK